MTPSVRIYPWYGVVSGDEVQQGDIFESCPVFSPSSTKLDDPDSRSYFDWAERDVIVMTQSCDLTKGRTKTEDVLVCALWFGSDFTSGHYLSTPKGLEDARRGNLPGLHLIGKCEETDFARTFRVVDFRRTWSLPVPYIRERAAQTLHLRLLPPYREHLSQAFARYFMRVGLPVDIPPFR